nr:P-type conjugative transfer protein TrbL [Xanthomonas cucurbitae]
MKKLLLGGLAAVFIAMLSEPAMAQQLNSSGVMNDVLQRFHNAASTWGPAIEAAASRLFWALVVISMVWTFGMMALRKADIGEFFAEFVRFTIFTGFFWWLLTNATTGMNIAGTIVQSMQQLGAQAGGLGDSRLGPSAIVDIGFELYDRTVEATSELGWRRMGTAIVMELMALGVLLVLALIAVNLLLLLASSWVLLYAGIFFLGFGGSRWTSDIAINYYKTVLGIAAQILAMVLIVAIGKQFLTHYYSQISGNMAAQELAVMLVVAVCLLFLVNRIPPLISGIVSGGGIGAAGGIGNFGASSIAAAGGAAIGAAAAVGSAVATGGAALAAGAASIGGGASAIKAAFEKAQGYAANDAGSMPMFGGGSDSGSDAGSFAQAAGFGGGSGSGAGTTTPLAQAAGFGSSSGSGASGSGCRLVCTSCWLWWRFRLRCGHHYTTCTGRRLRQQLGQRCQRFGWSQWAAVR